MVLCLLWSDVWSIARLVCLCARLLVCAVALWLESLLLCEPLFCYAFARVLVCLLICVCDFVCLVGRLLVWLVD